MGQKGFWDREKRREDLIQLKPILPNLNHIIPWENFRATLEDIYPKERKSNAGRKHYDVILMFKLLILQQLYNISDDELEYQVKDRFSFMEFLGLGIEDNIPDSKTVWLFRQKLVERNLTESLFETFDEFIRSAGYRAEKGQIVDATLVNVPKQRNSREENQTIKNGEVPEDWEESPHQLSQKDVDARWTKKNGQSFFGYKNHISIDVGYGFIRRYTVTNAAVHDSQMMAEIIDIDNQNDEIYGDSAYCSEKMEWALEKVGFISEIHQRSYRNRKLTSEEKIANLNRSRIRAKVEHVFGQWVTSMGGKMIRCIGLARAKAVIGLRNLAYNLKRLLYWENHRISVVK
jgi:IS5 family transposase